MFIRKCFKKAGELIDLNHLNDFILPVVLLERNLPYGLIEFSIFLESVRNMSKIISVLSL
jgi:hypothetical protein